MSSRNIDLYDRPVGTRANKIVAVFDIETIDEHLGENLSVVSKQFEVADMLAVSQNQEAAEDIWRSQVVFIASAFDFYLHEVVKLGIINMYHQEWDKTQKYSNLRFTMADVELACKDTEDEAWLKEWIDTEYAYKALMAYDAFTGVCNLIGVKVDDIAKIFYDRKSRVKPRDTLKQKIEDLFKRRNKIAHQADRKSTTAEKISISKEDVQQYFNDVQLILGAVSEAVRKK